MKKTIDGTPSRLVSLNVLVSLKSIAPGGYMWILTEMVVVVKKRRKSKKIIPRIHRAPEHPVSKKARQSYPNRQR